MKIYVADLAEYNAGRLYGKWLDLDNYADADELEEAVFEIPKGENEWAVHDYEYDYGDPDFGECPDLEDVFRYHELCREYGEAFAVWFSLYHPNMHRDDWEDDFRDRYYGEFDSYEALAEQLVDEGLFGEIPDAIASYLNYEAIGCDLQDEYTVEKGYCFCDC